jgi:hypothetical protein
MLGGRQPPISERPPTRERTLRALAGFSASDACQAQKTPRWPSERASPVLRYPPASSTERPPWATVRLWLSMISRGSKRAWKFPGHMTRVSWPSLSAIQVLMRPLTIAPTRVPPAWASVPIMPGETSVPRGSSANRGRSLRLPDVILRSLRAGRGRNMTRPKTGHRAIAFVVENRHRRTSAWRRDRSRGCLWWVAVPLGARRACRSVRTGRSAVRWALIRGLAEGSAFDGSGRSGESQRLEMPVQDRSVPHASVSHVRQSRRDAGVDAVPSDWYAGRRASLRSRVRRAASAASACSALVI